MSLTLSKTGVAITGHFNPHIISPNWLIRERILDSSGPVKGTMLLGSPELEIRFNIGDMEWAVHGTRLSIDAKTGSRPAEVAAQVMEKLPHTPVNAVGLNFVYSCDRDNWSGPNPQLGRLTRESLQELGDVQATGWRTAINYNDGVLVNVVFQIETDVVLNFNFHRSVENTAEAIKAVRLFSQDQECSQSLIDTLLKQDGDG